MDLGIYPLNAVRWITGEEPAKYSAQVTTVDNSGKFSSVEEAVEFTVSIWRQIIFESMAYGEGILTEKMMVD